jgi:hypothetical protein
MPLQTIGDSIWDATKGNSQPVTPAGKSDNPNATSKMLKRSYPTRAHGCNCDKLLNAWAIGYRFCAGRKQAAKHMVGGIP